MNEILNIYQSLSNVNSEYVSQYLIAFNDHRVFQGKSIQELEPVISHITSLLNEQSSRHNGLVLLHSFLSQCSLEILEQKGELWMTLCSKVCTQRRPVTSVSFAFSVLADLLTKTADIPELCKSASKNLIPKLLESLSDLSPRDHQSALKCVALCLSKYPGACGSSRHIVEKFILNFTDSSDENLVNLAGECLHLLQQVRGGAVHGLSQRDTWSQLQSELIINLHKIFDDLYKNTVETVDVPVIADSDGGMTKVQHKLKFPELVLNDDPIVRTCQLINRFNNLCVFLKIVLMEPFVVPKAIQPRRIMTLIARGLSINCNILAKNLIIDNIAIGALLPQIHVNLFKLLDALCLTLGGNMLLFAKNMCNLIIQSLQWTSSGKSIGFTRPFISVRVATYNTLSLWCKQCKSASLTETIAVKLIENILQDITPFQNEVTLTVLPGTGNKYLSKKAKQKLLKAQNDAANMTDNYSKVFNAHNTKIQYSDAGNRDLCAAALDALTNLIHSAGFFIDVVTLKDLHGKILLLAVDTLSSEPSTLYQSSLCRKWLYGALYALIMSPNYLCPPPIQYANIIFSLTHVRDNDPENREICADYLRTIEKIIHPQKETLRFPPELSDLMSALKSKNSKNLINLNNGKDVTSDDEQEKDDDYDEDDDDDAVDAADDNSDLKQIDNVDNIIDKPNIIHRNEVVESANDLNSSMHSEIDSIKEHESMGNEFVEEESVDNDEDEIISIDSYVTSKVDGNANANKRKSIHKPESETITLSDDEPICIDDESIEPHKKITKISDSTNVSNNITHQKEKSEDEIIAEIAATFVNELNVENSFQIL